MVVRRYKHPPALSAPPLAQAVEQHLKQALEDARGDSSRVELDAKMDAMLAELSQNKLETASLQGRCKTAQAEAARLRAQETALNKTVADLRDELHAETCRAAALEGKLDSIQDELQQERQRLKDTQQALGNQRKEALETRAKSANLEKQVAKLSIGSSTGALNLVCCWLLLSVECFDGPLLLGE